MKTKNIALVAVVIITLLLAAVVPVGALTWTDAGGCWTASDATYGYIKINASGIGMLPLPAGVTSVNVDMVGGGAGGGSGTTVVAYDGGGGAAGGFVNVTNYAVSGNVPYKVGAKGTGAAGDGQCGTDGGNTTFGTAYNALGGGKGGGHSCDPGNGGSGGGAALVTAGGLGTSGQGQNGGQGFGAGNHGGGGGGNQSAGGTATSDAAGQGTGGSGITSYLTGEYILLACGGGGAGNLGNGTGVGGCSGSGGKSDTAGQSAPANTGGGGGGTSRKATHAAGDGSDGIIFIRYVLPAGLTAAFTQNQTAGLYPLWVNFTDTSTGTPTTWNWSVNGVNEATTRNYTRLFNFWGNFTVNLTVTATGSNSTSTKYVQVYNRTSAQFSANATSGLSPLAIQFTDSSSNATSWNWSFFGTNYSALQNPTYTFSTPGTYTIRLNASNAYSYEWQNKTDYITVSTLTSSFNANVTTGVNPLVVMFNDTSMGTGITSYNVSFGDGGWSNQSTFPAANLTHLYSTQGNYTVSWYVFTSTSSASSSTIITVWGAANSLFSVFNTAGTAPFTTYLYDTSTNLTPGPATYYWMFGDGNTSTASALYYNWNITGTYSVNHSVSNGLSTSWNNQSAYITVGTPTPPVVAPVASFYGGPQIGAPPLNVFFTDVSSNTPTSWNWSFGDGLFSTSQNPTHWYNSSGFYTVGLTATNSAGSNSTSQTNFIMVY